MQKPNEDPGKFTQRKAGVGGVGGVEGHVWQWPQRH